MFSNKILLYCLLNWTMFRVYRLTEEATNGSLSAPDTRMLKAISKAAFEVDDYFRILEILRSRLTSLSGLVYLHV